MKKIQLAAIYTVLMLAISVTSFAQGPGFDPDIEPYATPISDDIWILVAAGLVLAYLKFRKMKLNVA